MQTETLERTSTGKVILDKDTNPDLITGEPGSHPVGTGLGAAGGGLAGAGLGTAVAGPVGTVVGAFVGAVAGGYGGKGLAEIIDPTVEDAYWRDRHGTMTYAEPESDYETYSAGYRTGYEGPSRYGLDKSFDDVEPSLKADYERSKDNLAVSWDKAKAAVRAAYEKARQALRDAV